jgi:DinB superfamily
MRFEDVPGQLERTTSEVATATDVWSQENWQLRREPGKWSRIEIIGHLLDSARNNTERVVRALSVASLEWPGYQQEEQVHVQRYHDAPPKQTVTMWLLMNHHLAHVVRGIPEAKRTTPCTILGWRTLPLDLLVIDYLAHLEHHVRQVFEGPV